MLGFGQEQVTHRRFIPATPSPGGLHGCLQLRVALRLAQLQQPDHLPRPLCLPLPPHQRLPELVVAGGPTFLFPPLRQRSGSRQGAGLPLQHRQIMFQIQDLLPALVATLVACHTGAFLPDFAGGGLHLHLHGGSSFHGGRVPVRPHLHASLRVHHRKTALR